MISIEHKNLQVKIKEGELISLKRENYEYIHQKGSPGWRNSDTEMFPIIGPTAEAEYTVQTPRGEAFQDQHGLLRELQYNLVEQTATTAVFRKNYKAGTSVRNSKFPDKSTEEFLSWPYDFSFSKRFALSENKLEITFKVTGEEGIPYMLGYHPAFKLYTKNPKIKTGDRAISLAEVLAAGSRAIEIADCNEISLHDKREVRIETEGFGHFMLWTEVPNMVCIEPITFYPYFVEQKLLHTGFQELGAEPAVFTVKISI